MSHIDALSDKTLVKILDYLSPKLIKSCTFVCRRWNRVIGNSQELMDKFQLNLNKYSEIIEAKVKNLRKKYVSIEIDTEDFFDERLFASLNTENLKKLRLSCFTIRKSELANVMSSLKSLRIFEVMDVILDSDEIVPIGKIDLKLEELVLSLCSIDNFLSIINTNSLIKLDVSENGTSQELISFLNCQKDLKTLSVAYETALSFIVSPEIVNLDFRLRNFYFESRLKITSVHLSYLYQFLMVHQQTLENLLISDLSRNYDYHEFVFRNLPKVKNFELNAKNFATEGLQFASNMSPIPNIKKVNITEYRESSSTFPIHLLLNKLPNIEIIYLDSVHNDTLKFIAQNMINLEQIRLRLLASNIITDHTIFFPKLKKLNIGGVYDSDYWKHFIGRHSATLEEITLDLSLEDFVKEVILDEIFRCLNLKYLEIETSAAAIPSLFNKIFISSTPFQSSKHWKLVMTVDDMSIEFSTSFRFPDDINEWLRRCKLWDENKFDSYLGGLIQNEIIGMLGDNYEKVLMYTNYPQYYDAVSVVSEEVDPVITENSS